METNQPKEEIKTSECGLSNESDRLFIEVYLKLTASESRVKELEEQNERLMEANEAHEDTGIKEQWRIQELERLVEERTKLIKEAYTTGLNTGYIDGNYDFEKWSKEKGI